MEAFIEWCVGHETGPAYDMNTFVLDVYRALGRPKKRFVHFPYLGGLCFDLLAFVTRRKFAVSAIRVKKFSQDTYFTSSHVPALSRLRVASAIRLTTSSSAGWTVTHSAGRTVPFAQLVF